MSRPRAVAVVDAVTVIALLDTRNAHHFEARRTVAGLAGGFKVIHPINLAEVLVLPARSSHENAIQIKLANAGFKTFSTLPAEAVQLARARAHTGLKMPDTCAYVTAVNRSLPLVTFDRRLTAASRARGITVLGAPAEW